MNYLIKTLIDLKNKENLDVFCNDILHEINELFVIYPPTNLKENIPNLEDLDKIYKILRVLTDISVKGNGNHVRTFLENVKKSQNRIKYCDIYLHYLENIINN